MKKKRTIKITHPQLRRIRNGLRAILSQAKSTQMNQILDRKWELKQLDGFWEESHPDYEKLHREIIKLATQENKLRSAYNASIIKCPVCMKIDKDMTYNPVLEKWYCIECYEENKKFETKQGHPELYP